MYICVCKGISDRHVKQAFHEGQNTLQQLRCQTGAGTQCGCCRRAVRDLLVSLEDNKSLPVNSVS